jgi:hypothetical protein
MYNLLGYGASQSDCAKSVIVDNGDANFLIDNPAKAELLRIVSRKNSDILADWECANGIRRCQAKKVVRWHTRGNVYVGGPQVAVKTSCKDFASCCLVEETVRSSRSAWTVEHTNVSVAESVHYHLGANQVVLLNLSEGSIDIVGQDCTTRINDYLLGTKSGDACSKNLLILFLLNGFLSLNLSAVNDIEATGLDLAETNRWVSSDFPGWNKNLLAFYNLVRNSASTSCLRALLLVTSEMLPLLRTSFLVEALFLTRL